MQPDITNALRAGLDAINTHVAGWTAIINAAPPERRAAVAELAGELLLQVQRQSIERFTHEVIAALAEADGVMRAAARIDPENKS